MRWRNRPRCEFLFVPKMLTLVRAKSARRTQSRPRRCALPQRSSRAARSGADRATCCADGRHELVSSVAPALDALRVGVAAAVGFPEVLVRRCSYILVRPPRARGLKVRDGGPLTLRLCCVRSPPDAILLPPRVACMCFLADSVQPGRCRTTSTDVPELSELVYYHGRVRQGASRPTSARSGGSATPLPNTALERAGQPAGEQLWVGWRVRGGSEPALARPSGSAGGTCARARLAEPVRGIGRPPMSDLGFCYVSTAFCSWRHVRVSAVCRERA